MIWLGLRDSFGKTKLGMCFANLVHALCKRNQPTGSAFNESDFGPRIAIQHAAGHQIHGAGAGIHHLVRIVDDASARAAFNDDRFKAGAGVHHKNDAQLRAFGENDVPFLVIIFGQVRRGIRPAASLR